MAFLIVKRPGETAKVSAVEHHPGEKFLITLGCDFRPMY